MSLFRLCGNKVTHHWRSWLISYLRWVGCFSQSKGTHFLRFLAPHVPPILIDLRRFLFISRHWIRPFHNSLPIFWFIRTLSFPGFKLFVIVQWISSTRLFYFSFCSSFFRRHYLGESNFEVLSFLFFILTSVSFILLHLLQGHTHELESKLCNCHRHGGCYAIPLLCSRAALLP